MGELSDLASRLEDFLGHPEIPAEIKALVKQYLDPDPEWAQSDEEAEAQNAPAAEAAPDPE